MFGKSMVECGPFAKTKKDVDAFCHNLVLSYAISSCVDQLIKVQKEYEDAVLIGDQGLIEQKRLEMQVYQSSIQLTACVLDENEDIST